MTRTGPGKVYIYPYSGGVQLALYNFDIDGHALKHEHEVALDRKIVPVLRSGGRAAILAQASRTGTPGHNLRLSRRRGRAVIDHLRRGFGGNFPLYLDRRVGESHAEHQGQADDTENEWYRSVIVVAGRASRRLPTPPPRPAPPPRFQLPCDYYRFWIAWETGLKQAWALSLGGQYATALDERGGTYFRASPEETEPEGAWGLGMVFYMKPDRTYFIMAMGPAMSRHYQSMSTVQLLQMYEWYQGEAAPNGPYEFIRDADRRIARMESERRALGCSGAAFYPAPLGGRGTTAAPLTPEADPRGRMY